MKSCFVIQGYGKKTDYRNGRMLDLDASYQVIKDAVESVGLACIRADEIQHSGTIDVPMYEHLLNADLVIADLSTYNVNAVFELGVRYALRPHATIIVADDQFQNPFDFSHIVIRRYKHLGEDLGAKEAKRFGDDLKAAITVIVAMANIDSPIYTLLPYLQPPQSKKAVDDARTMAKPPVAGPMAGPEIFAEPEPTEPDFYCLQPAPTATSHAKPSARRSRFATNALVSGQAQGGPSDWSSEPPELGAGNDAAQDDLGDRGLVALNTKQLLERAHDMIKHGRFPDARVLLEEARKRRPNDSFVIQRLALAIYKSEQPDIQSALLDAREVVRSLGPETSNNPETLGLWGAIHKRMWEFLRPVPWQIQLVRDLLDTSIAAYERGFSIKRDHYNGTNLAYMLNVRALEALKAGKREDAIADHTLATRIRRDLTQRAMAHLENLPLEFSEERFWVLASLWEAALGLGDVAARSRWETELHAMNPPQWMHDRRESQGKRLLSLLTEYATLSK